VAKNAFPVTLAGCLYNSLYYRTSRDCVEEVVHVMKHSVIILVFWVGWVPTMTPSSMITMN